MRWRAITVARARGAGVTALHVVPFHPVFAPFVELIPTTPAALEPAERAGLARALERFVAAQGAKDLAIDTALVEAPHVHSEILAQAGRLRADLIVMGTHGRSGFQRLFLGSVTEKVLRSAKEPVLTVGLPALDNAGATPVFTRIVCAIDFSECSRAAFGYALSMVEGTQAHVTALNVLDWVPIASDPLMGPFDPTQFQAAVERTAREHLHRVVAERPVQGIDVEEVVISGRPHHGILRIAAERNADLIVLGIHGKNPVDRMLFGSTAEPVVRRATCPVLTIRADVATGAAAA